MIGIGYTTDKMFVIELIVDVFFRLSKLQVCFAVLTLSIRIVAGFSWAHQSQKQSSRGELIKSS